MVSKKSSRFTSFSNAKRKYRMSIPGFRSLKFILKISSRGISWILQCVYSLRSKNILFPMYFDHLPALNLLHSIILKNHIWFDQKPGPIWRFFFQSNRSIEDNHNDRWSPKVQYSFWTNVTTIGNDI